MWKLVNILVSVMSIGVLAGCQSSAIVAINKTLNMGMELEPAMKGRNIAGGVTFDEEWAGAMSYAAKNQLVAMGVNKGDPEYSMRVVRVNTRHPAYAGWMASGDKIWPTSAIVPDHIPKLHTFDIVEIRQTGTWEVNKNFAKTGEGNIVVRILCKYGDPAYESCLDRQPRIGKHRGFGETGTLYPVSAKEYGFSYTPMYDQNGKAIR